MPDALLTPEELRQRLNCGLSTVYRLTAKGILPAVKIPGTSLVRFRRESVEKLLAEWESNGGRRKRR